MRKIRFLEYYYIKQIISLLTQKNSESSFLPDLNFYCTLEYKIKS
ncbi:hypothetical protein SAMN05444396_110113 [Flavobacterium segetis]|uniref:Uncharacterized protein n=1 Tax=Flavobacterium segetis TaxID=271157 RepID=A0A1M5JF43_9FLAO|nr:hypothetical protein SAMN05444396_110113 [Flavobacterium segetis]